LDLEDPSNVSSKFKTTNDFKYFSGWLQANILGDRLNYNVRLDRKRNGELLLNEKLHVHQDNLHFLGTAKLSLNNLKLARYNALLAYRHKDFDVVLQHLSRPKLEHLELGEFNLAGYYRFGAHQAGAKIIHRHWEKDSSKITGVIGGVFKVDKKTNVKAKIDTNTNLALSLKHKHSSNLWATIGTAISLSNPSTYVSQRFIPVPIGVQLEFFY